jgi:putative endonuclease
MRLMRRKTPARAAASRRLGRGDGVTALIEEAGRAHRRAMEKGGWVYILAHKSQGTLYVGVTADLARRAHQHRSAATAGFTRRYNVHRLVWCERHEDIGDAIAREKSLKRWRRAWKVSLIERENPAWDDLFERFI